jgi:hypothetical protein
VTRVGKQSFDAWPDAASAWLLHPSFGLLRGIKPLPLVESQLPADFVALPEGEQWQRRRATIGAACFWALDEGADHVRVSTYEKADQDRLLFKGFDRVDRSDFQTRATPDTMDVTTGVLVFDRIWIMRGATVSLYVHETWDSVVVADTTEAIDRLRGRLPIY